MISYVIYKSDGRIVGSGYNFEENIFLSHGELLLTCEVGTVITRSNYVSNGEVKERPTLPTTLSGLTLNDVPLGASVLIEGQSYTATSETIELEFSLPGIYTVTIEKWPYITKELTVEN